MRRLLPLVLAFAGLAAGAASAHPSGAGDPGLPPHGRLGVQLQSMTPELREFMGAPKDRGVLVVRVHEGSPAEAAGVKVGDVIVTVGGEAAGDVSDVVGEVAAADENASIELEVVREGGTKELRAALTGKPYEHFSGGEHFRWLPRGMQHLGPDLEKRMEELERRLEELERKLQESLRPAPGRAT